MLRKWYRGLVNRTRTRHVGNLRIPYFVALGQCEPEYDQGHAVVVWYDDLLLLAERVGKLENAAEMLWVVLANVSGSDWSKQSPEWQEAAARWRDNYFKVLGNGQR